MLCLVKFRSFGVSKVLPSFLEVSWSFPPGPLLQGSRLQQYTLSIVLPGLRRDPSVVSRVHFVGRWARVLRTGEYTSNSQNRLQS